MLLFFKKNKKIIQFIVVGAGLYVLWTIFYNTYVKTSTTWDYHLNDNIANVSIWMFDWLGFDAAKEIDSDHVIVSLIKTKAIILMIFAKCIINIPSGIYQILDFQL